ncbi:MAG: LamG domain-containing protein [Planctomycetota bacterium]|nr:MAG: LamG domain-containing protein [Planctomycetota bacterium]
MQQEPTDLVWTTPSRDASGSMPIGNGELGANVWVEENGDLLLLLSRTDSWSEANRLLKLGRLRVHMEPNPFAAGQPFRQALVLQEGRLEVTAGSAPVSLRIFVDSDAPVLYVIGTCEEPVAVRAHLESWRTQRRRLSGEELKSSWTMRDAPESVQVAESADQFLEDASGVSWCHRNEDSIVPWTLGHQGLGEFADLAGDPLLGRTFGGRLRAPGFAKDGAKGLRSGPTRAFVLQVATHTAVTGDRTQWQEELASVAARSALPGAADRTAAWWREFWQRSWIVVQARSLPVPRNDHPLRMGIDGNGQNRWLGAMGAFFCADIALSDAALRAAIREPPDAVIPFDPALAPAAGAAPRFERGITVGAWVYPASGAGPGRIFDKITAGGSDGFLLDRQPDGTLRWIVGARSLSAPGQVPAERWTHVAARYEPEHGRMSLFVNGALVSEDRLDHTPGQTLTRSYALQRWMLACGGRGAYPIKFNGSIFTVEPRHAGGPDFDPDWRRWGGDFWWQNTRLPYHAMLASGDFELMAPLFRMYGGALPLCGARARRYYGAEGAYFPETMTHFGSYGNGDYGWERAGLEPGKVLCPWWEYAWNQGPELVALMLDYQDYAGDDEFLQRELLPMAEPVLRYFESRFLKEGRLVVQPTQALETHWYEVINDMPSVAGLHAVLPRLLAREPRAEWQRLLAALPPLPVVERDGARVLAAAERFQATRQNCETPELYALWPFRLYGIGRPRLEEARRAYERRHDRFSAGWPQDGQFAALLGLTEEARANLLAKAGNSHPAMRFPALWGPNFDWCPDQCHGANLMLTLQLMLLQCHGDEIRVLPAWPADWDVSFRLHAPGRTQVECVYRDGKIETLQVTPPQRRADVVVPEMPAR